MNALFYLANSGFAAWFATTRAFGPDAGSCVWFILLAIMSAVSQLSTKPTPKDP